MMKQQIATYIAKEILDLLAENGEYHIVDGYRPFTVKFRELEIFHSTPFTRLPDCEDEYLIDIWTPNEKVFSVRWKNDVKDLDIVRFKRGEWENSFLKSNKSF